MKGKEGGGEGEETKAIGNGINAQTKERKNFWFAGSGNVVPSFFRFYLIIVK